MNAPAQSKPDESAIRKILDDEIAAWNQGDSDGYSKHFAADGTFTNINGMFFKGRQAFRERHEIVFKGPFRGTVLQLQVESLRILTPDVAVCETLGLRRNSAGFCVLFFFANQLHSDRMNFTRREGMRE